MAKISLRAYNREIESLIEEGHLDEAVAHCQHILKTFPMYVETYKLLGKTFLEARRYADASDIFQRVLMAIPDDFISHVGMSIIRDDEGKLDEAIWHMERAFETQPSNSAIQGELRRLYGKRDGVEPTKIRLSRDALANLYSQGELFNQAIAEIRSVLLGDPNRPDLQVMLSRAYFFAEKNVDAAEMANLLLTKYPYCLDALKVLVEILSSSENNDQVQSYRQRLHLLDPYLAFVTGSLFEANKVADSTVNIEKLEYDARSIPGASQPAWASSLGIKIQDDNREGNVPSWVNEMENLDTQGNHPDENRNDGPEMRNMQDSTIDDGSNAPSSDPTIEDNIIPESGNEETLVEAEIPEWLKSKAPQEIKNEDSEESGAKKISMKEEPLPDWLSDTAGEERKFLQQDASIFEEGNKPESESPTQDENAISGAEDMNERISDISNEKDLPMVDDLPNYEKIYIPENQTFFVDEASSSIPQHQENEPSETVDETLEWLNRLDTQEKNEPSKLEEQPEITDETIPEWLTSPEISPDGGDENTSHIQESDEVKIEGSDIPGTDTIRDMDTGNTEKSGKAEDETLTWLRNLGEKSGPDSESHSGITPAETSISTNEDEPGIEPDLSWLSDLAKDVPPITPQQEITEKSEKEEAPPDASKSPISTLNFKASDDEEPLPDWLQEEDLNTSSVVDNTMNPPGEIKEPELPKWFDESTSALEETAATEPTEWLPIEEPIPAQEEETPIEKELIPDNSSTAGAVDDTVNLKLKQSTSKTSSSEKDMDILHSAQDSMQNNFLEDAIPNYTKLIKRGRLLDEVIHDLRGRIASQPNNAIIWQTLGDAYMRANRLQEALDAFTKAEEFLK